MQETNRVGGRDKWLPDCHNITGGVPNGNIASATNVKVRPPHSDQCAARVWAHMRLHSRVVQPWTLKEALDIAMYICIH